MLSTKYYMIKRASDELKALDDSLYKEELYRQLLGLHKTKAMLRSWLPVGGALSGWGLDRYAQKSNPLMHVFAGTGVGYLTGGLLDRFLISPKIKKLERRILELS